MSRRTVRYALPAAVLVVLLAGGGFAALETKTVTSAAASLFVREAEAPEERRERDFEQRILRELAELRAQLRGGGERPR